MSVLIDIQPLNEDLIENTLSEEEIDTELERYKNIVNSDDMKQALKEDGIEVAIAAGTVVAIVAGMIRWLKNKYRLTAERALNQSKEINDLYTKIEDLLKHDKMARFRHRNDKIDCTTKIIVLKDKQNGKLYEPMADFLAYNPEYAVNRIENALSSTASAQDRQKSLVEKKDTLIAEIQNEFQKNHGFILQVEPFLMVKDYKAQRLERVLMVYKDDISYMYSAISSINEYVSVEFEYLNYIQDAYTKLLSKHSNDKLAKQIIDDVFKLILKNTSLSLDFNNALLSLYEEDIKFYADALIKLYDYIRS